MSVTVTERAVKYMAQDLHKRGIPEACVRFGVRGGGCTGYSYVFEYCDAPRDSDSVFEFGEVRLIVDPKSLKLLEGTVIDFETGIRGHGFSFDNPNVHRNCGCGESFTLRS